jgi:hypothetical protein
MGRQSAAELKRPGAGSTTADIHSYARELCRGPPERECLVFGRQLFLEAADDET